MNKDKLIPELRFLEFQNEGKWDLNEFGELINLLADFTANGSFASLKENVTYYSNEEYAVLVRTTDLDKKIFTPARFTDKRGYDFLSKTSLFGNEIVMANVGSIGKVFRVPYYKKPMTLAPNTYVLKFNDFVDEDFIYQLMLRPEFEKKLLSMVGSSTLMAINKSNLRSIKVAVPNEKEQQKIASCLSSLDEVIAAHSQKLELLIDHKKGLMQNLFPTNSITNDQLRITNEKSITNYESSITSEDDQFVIRNSQIRNSKVPKYRFKEFEKDGEWVENELNDFCFNISSGKDKNQDDGEFDLYGSTGIIGRTDNLSYEGDYILVARVGANAGLLNRANGQFGVTDNTLVLNLKEIEKVDFIYYSLDKIGLNKLVFGSGQPLVTGTQLKELIIPTPANPQEQQKIASCLSSLDALIAAQAEKIEQLKLHKKGLMQGLFPKSITN